MLTVGSLFTGIGGLDLGLERAGMQIRWQVEIDPYCNSVLEKHWPGVKRYGDIRELKGDELEEVELICGGFPCQPVSKSGKRRGSADERWLWPEFIRIVRKVRPRYILVENVPGLLSIDSGGLMGQVLGDMAACGYRSEWDCISAQSVGALHRRDRIFIVSYSDDGRHIHLSHEEHTDALGVKTQSHIGESRSHISDDDSDRCQGREISIFSGQPRQAISDSEWCRWWDAEPEVDRVVDGLSTRMDRDRLEALGNAVVPQVAEYIGGLIVNHDRTHTPTP